MPHVIVVGAGVLGASVAFRLAQAGSEVTILEAGRVGGGTSSCSYAWLNSGNKTPRSYHDLNVAGMQAHFALAEEFPATPWLHRSGGIEITSGAKDGATLAAKVARLSDWGYAAEVIDAARLAELEPDLVLDAIDAPTIAWCPEEGWIDPVLFAQWMVRAAERHGAVLRIGARVVAVSEAAGRVTGVVMEDGEAIAADGVVNCAGRLADLVGGDRAPRIPLAPRVGFLAFTPPVPVTLRNVLRTALVDMRPDGAGRLMLHDNAIDAALPLDAELSPAMPQAASMVRQAARLFPGLRDVQAEAVRITARPIPSDGYSAVGPMPGLEGYYLAVTHSAVTLSAHMAKLIAREVVGQTPAPELEPFRPARFFSNRPAIEGGAEAFTSAG